MKKSDLFKIIQAQAENQHIDPAIVYGVCCQESSLRPTAIRHEPGYRWLYKPSITIMKNAGARREEEAAQKTSWGLMQVMGGVLRELGYTGDLSDILADPEAQVRYGCIHLRKKINQFGLIPGIAAYNTGCPKINPDGKYINQHYVDKVINYSKSFEKELEKWQA